MGLDSSLGPQPPRLAFSRRSPLIPLVLCSPSNARSRGDPACQGRGSPQSGVRSLLDRRLSIALGWHRPSHAPTESAGAAQTIAAPLGAAAGRRAGPARAGAGGPAGG